jgi:REP element-mobilizing transposase RayT
MGRKKTAQTQLAFRTRGGKRRGAGRKPCGSIAGVSHRARPASYAREPVLVTMKVRREVWNLRTQRVMRRLLPALLAAGARLRIVQFSVQSDHVHILAEADDAGALSRGVQGLAVRLARAVNRVMKRTGKVFKDRFHSRVLRSPRQMRNALAYVLGNARHHGVALPPRGVDPCSSAARFDGWAGAIVTSTHWLARAAAAIAVAPRTWLLRIGWRRGGPPLDPDHRPGPLPAA